jgi:hypothetical protein
MRIALLLLLALPGFSLELDGALRGLKTIHVQSGAFTKSFADQNQILSLVAKCLTDGGLTATAGDSSGPEPASYDATAVVSFTARELGKDLEQMLVIEARIDVYAAAKTTFGSLGAVCIDEEREASTAWSFQLPKLPMAKSYLSLADQLLTRWARVNAKPLTSPSPDP